MASTKSENHLVFDLREIDKKMLDQVGGKAANLGELFRIDSINVPEGCCITTAAFKKIISQTPSLTPLIAGLSGLKSEDRLQIAELGAQIRELIISTQIPENIREQVITHLVKLGEHHAYAVRSSATAEDLPGASFAGQQDSYLNIIGIEEILRHISKCWASLFTDRAIAYRIQNDFDHNEVYLSVIIQQMVFPTASGILFTADPVSSNRKISSIDASFGLGEALVSGQVSADCYKIKSNQIIDKRIAVKKIAIYGKKEGGTITVQPDAGDQQKQTLTDEDILTLSGLGKKIEAHFGFPQDIEWCFADNKFYVVQSRPITTLFPIPETDDDENHVYVSVGHQQMMTDALKPLGLSIRSFSTAATMRNAGGRQFVDITKMLASPVNRPGVIDALGKSDPLIKDALLTIVERDDFIKLLPAEPTNEDPNKRKPVWATKEIENDPAIVADLIRVSEAVIEDLKEQIKTKNGTDLFDFIKSDIDRLMKMFLDPRNMGAVITAMNAAFWLNEKMNEWLGEKSVSDTLSQSVPNNVTAEMGLALLDVADVIRPYPAVIRYLEAVRDEDFLTRLPHFDGGVKVQEAFNHFLNKYGMRCAGEIDITKTRWSEKPAILLPFILSNIKNFEPGEGARKFEEGKKKSLDKEQDLLKRLKQLPEGEEKAKETKEKISVIRNLTGYREYPKYAIVSRYFIYKQALLTEIEPLVATGIIQDKEDIFYLTFDELREVVNTKTIDYQLVEQRKQEHKRFEKLNPPRVITSDGEIVVGKYKRENLPANALGGLPVSSGVVEGRARVILSMEDAAFGDNDILVTPFTDPSWTPLFVSIKGLITEVGGLMTHGAVIAREYGLPAVVGVEDATKLIKDGQQIRLHGTEGYVELL